MVHPAYIGVTGFMSQGDVREVLSALPSDSQRKLMVGVLASSKTLRGIPNKWPNRYPKPPDIAGIFVSHPAALNLVHFSTEWPGRLLEDMFAVTDLAGENFHGFQLNVRWPKLCILEAYKERYPKNVLVLQCGPAALREQGWQPKRVAALAKSYEGVCEYLLIDPSGGYGIPFDPDQGLALLEALHAPGGTMGFGIAGGLSPETLDLLKPILEVFPGISIDAEGRLRDAEDYLDVARAKRFVALADALLRQHGG